MPVNLSWISITLLFLLYWSLFIDTHCYQFIRVRFLFSKFHFILLIEFQFGFSESKSHQNVQNAKTRIPDVASRRLGNVAVLYQQCQPCPNWIIIYHLFLSIAIVYRVGCLATMKPVVSAGNLWMRLSVIPGSFLNAESVEFLALQVVLLRINVPERIIVLQSVSVVFVVDIHAKIRVERYGFIK